MSNDKGFQLSERLTCAKGLEFFCIVLKGNIIYQWIQKYRVFSRATRNSAFISQLLDNQEAGNSRNSCIKQKVRQNDPTVFSELKHCMNLWTVTSGVNLAKQKALNIYKGKPSCQNITFHCIKVNIIEYFEFQIFKKTKYKILTKAILRPILFPQIWFVLRILKLNSNY